MAEKRLEFWPERSPIRPIAFITMARDEETFLKAWINNGLRIHADADFFVLDHASLTPLAETPGLSGLAKQARLNVLRIPAVPFDDDYKAMALSNLAKILVHSHEVVVTSDCDELLVGFGIAPDAVYAKLLELGDFSAPIGFEIVHHTLEEAPFDPTVPVARQRNYGFFTAGYTKPVIWRRRTEFGAGLHRIRDDFSYEPSLALLHIRSADFALAAERASLRHQYELSSVQVAGGRGAHWHRPAEQALDFHKELLSQTAMPSARTLLGAFTDGLREAHSVNNNGFWGHDIKPVSEFCTLDGLLT